MPGRSQTAPQLQLNVNWVQWRVTDSYKPKRRKNEKTKENITYYNMGKKQRRLECQGDHRLHHSYN